MEKTYKLDGSDIPTGAWDESGLYKFFDKENAQKVKMYDKWQWLAQYLYNVSKEQLASNNCNVLGLNILLTTKDYSSYNERINALRAKNHDLSTEAQRLAAELEAARSRKPEVVNESKVTASPVALFFNIGKATLDKKELTNLEFYVNNAIKADKNKTFTLIGSADSATGSKELNQRLSEQRMEYVYNLLVEKYKISPERLVKKAEGDTNNRFSEPELNRAVIVE